MKKLLLFPVCLLLFNSLSAETEGRIENIMFFPPEYYVGDIVELRAVLVPPQGAVLNLPVSLPESLWLNMESVALRELSADRYELRVVFASYYPGTRTLPAINLGGMTLDRLRIHTSTVIGDTHLFLSDIKDPMYIPGTFVLLAAAVVATLGGPLFIVLFILFVKRNSRDFLKRFSLTLPYRRFCKSIRELNSGFFSLSDRDFYFALSEGIRNYLSDKTGEDFLTVTLEEIGALMPRYLPVFEDQKQIIKLLHYADLIKFSGGGSALEKKRRDLDEAAILIKQIERSYEAKNRGDS